MGDWSNHFEDFSEENSTDNIDGRFHSAKAKLTRERIVLDGNTDIKQMLTDAWKAEKERSFIGIVDCPQCGWNELHTYYITGRYHLCECQDCGIFGKGSTCDEAIKAASDAIGEGLDWREQPYPFRQTRLRDIDD
jgi:hypothetical protein